MNRLSYDELGSLVTHLQPLIIGSFLKNIYHYKGKWLFKFTNVSLIYEPTTSIWVGNFEERETEIHSVCRKLRLTICNLKVKDFFILHKDRTIVFDFYEHYLIIENYAKGNVILTDTSLNVIVLTRIYNDVSHNKKYTANFIKNENTEFKKNLTIETSQSMYENKIKSKKKKEKEKIDPIKFQINELENKLNDIINKIDKETDFKLLEELHTNRKKILYKLDRAKNLKTIKKETKKINYITLNNKKWYHSYYWWITKNGFLVVGGKNADQSEKLVKSYMADTDYYFHSDSVGSGSFILFNKNNNPSDIDLDDTANGLLSLSQQWKNGVGSSVYWVYGHQVSKTPPTGEYITKGSFIVNGTRNYIKVDTLILGYALTKENELLLAPYRIIQRYNKPFIKILPKTDTKKGNMKKLVTLIKELYKVKELPQNISLFNYPCNITKII